METLALLLFILLLLNRKELAFLSNPIKRKYHKIDMKLKQFAFKSRLYTAIYSIWETIRLTVLYSVSIMTNIFIWLVFIMLCLYTIIIFTSIIP